jgi:hypothetical protein
MLPSPVRRTALLTLGGLLGGLLSIVAVAVPAQASAGCLSETGIPFVTQCDDETPPETGAATATVTGSTVTVTAPGTPSPGTDTGAVLLECQIDASLTWTSCVFPGLPEGQHTFRVRAYDATDAAITAICNAAPLDCTSGYVEVPDYDATPSFTDATVTGGGGGGTTPPPSGPNGAPETQIGGGPRDRITPGTPVTLSRKVSVTLTSSEPATFNCAINAKKVKCVPGVNVLKKLRPGPQVLVAQAVDKDGNFDATPATLSFYVPINLNPSQGRHWQKVKSRGSYAHDYVATKVRGAVLVAGRASSVHEVRLVAPTGRRFGKVAVRVGKGRWHKVSLKSAKGKQVQVFEISPPGAKPLSGAIQIKALKIPRGGVVAVDAIVAR